MFSICLSVFITTVSSICIIHLQACRGGKLDEGVDIEVADAQGEMPSPQEYDAMDIDEPVIRRIPAEADFLMAYSVVSG